MLSLRSAFFTPIDGSQVKQMLGRRFARGNNENMKFNIFDYMLRFYSLKYWQILLINFAFGVICQSFIVISFIVKGLDMREEIFIIGIVVFLFPLIIMLLFRFFSPLLNIQGYLIERIFNKPGFENKWLYYNKIFIVIMLIIIECSIAIYFILKTLIN
jgi:hypothetical protein